MVKVSVLKAATSLATYDLCIDRGHITKHGCYWALRTHGLGSSGERAQACDWGVEQWGQMQGYMNI